MTTEFDGEIDEVFLKEFEGAIDDHEREWQLVFSNGELTPKARRSTRRLEKFTTSKPVLRALINEVRHLRELAYPKTEHRRSGEEGEGDDYCTVCRFAVGSEEHSYADCVKNLAQADSYVNDLLIEENKRLAAESQLLIDGFARWKRGDLDTEEFEGLFHERTQRT